MNNPVDTDIPGAATSNGSPQPKTADRIAQKAHDYVDRIAAQAGAAEAQLRSSYGDAGERLHGSRDEVKARYDELNSTVRDYVHEHPMTSIGVAFGAGVLLAALLRK